MEVGLFFFFSVKKGEGEEKEKEKEKEKEEILQRVHCTCVQQAKGQAHHGSDEVSAALS